MNSRALAAVTSVALLVGLLTFDHLRARPLQVAHAGSNGQRGGHVDAKVLRFVILGAMTEAEEEATPRIEEILHVWQHQLEARLDERFLAGFGGYWEKRKNDVIWIWNTAADKIRSASETADERWNRAMSELVAAAIGDLETLNRESEKVLAKIATVYSEAVERRLNVVSASYIEKGVELAPLLRELTHSLQMHSDDLPKNTLNNAAISTYWVTRAFISVATGPQLTQKALLTLDTSLGSGVCSYAVGMKMCQSAGNGLRSGGSWLIGKAGVSRASIALLAAPLATVVASVVTAWSEYNDFGEARTVILAKAKEGLAASTRRLVGRDGAIGTAMRGVRTEVLAQLDMKSARSIVDYALASIFE